jgi:hypothetical protein
MQAHLFHYRTTCFVEGSLSIRVSQAADRLR